ncbi:MAG: sigma-70 family RNA polymerase sigma factor [Planctomycetes bacterium]|nr:sigma-70 family RNA polymerase sigma factor [Planctomycetota bacterium]
MDEPLPDFDWTQAKLERAKQGDGGAMRELLEVYNKPLLLRVRTMMGPRARQHAETGDFVQETILAALKRLDSVDLASSRAFLAWLTTIARHRIIDSVRKKYEDSFTEFATTMLGSSNERPSQHAIHHEELDRLALALESLDADRRRVIELRNFEGLTFGAIARELDRSENAVQLLHARAVSELGRILDT